MVIMRQVLRAVVLCVLVYKPNYGQDTSIHFACEYPNCKCKPLSLDSDQYELECTTSSVEAFILPKQQSTNIVHLSIQCDANNDLLTLLHRIDSDLEFVRSLTLKNCETDLYDIITVRTFHNLKYLTITGARGNLSDSIKLNNGLAVLEKLVSLNISDNSLTKLPSLCLQSELVFLNMSGNGLSSVTSPYRNCTDETPGKLKVLDLSRNRLTELEPWIDERTRSLTDLYINSNLFDENDLTALANFSNLTYLDISNNIINVFPNTSFRNNQRLVNLNISQNSITSLESGVMSGMINLEYLYMQHNKLSLLQDDVFTNLSHLKRLDLGFNVFRALPFTIFDPLLSLERLTLRDNNLVDLPTFRHLGSLLMLDLGNNKIAALKRNTFSSLKLLEGLSLTRNSLTTMHFKTFDFSQNLYLLDLSYNNISYLIDDMNRKSSNLSKISYLRLDNNRLVDISLIGKHFLGLNYLILDNNLIRTVNRNSLPQPLKILSLSDNRISRVASFVFRDMYQLQTVTLQRNYPYFYNLKQSSVQIRPSLEPKPNFYIGGNLFMCDCNIAYLKAWDKGRNKINALRQYHPTFSDMQDVYCITLYDNVATKFRDTPMSHFVCSYNGGRHCTFGCECCLQNNCTCDYTCPDNCSCYYGGSLWINDVYERIHCDNRSLTEIPHNIPVNATHLYLGDNQIHSLSTGRFYYLKYVQYLYLNNSHITRIGSDVFQGMDRLEVLFLDQNVIAELMNNSFTGLHKLRELHLEYNIISFIEEGTFSMLTNLKRLYLQNNLLNAISVDVFGRTENPPAISLLGNPWSCDCQSMAILKEFMNVYGSVIVRAEELKCYWFNNTSRTNNVQNYSENKYPIDNESGIPVLQYDYDSVCSDNKTIVNVYVAQVVFLDDGRHVSALVTVVVIIVIAMAVMAVGYWKRRELQAWIFIKFGRRVFNKNKHLNEAGRRYDAFVSYSSKDEHMVVHELAPRLEGADNPYKLCLHYRDFPVGECIADTIINSIEASKRTLMLISENFLASEWCRYEFQTAHHHILKENTHRLIMVLLHDLDIEHVDPDLRVHLKTGNFLKYDDPWFWEKLCFALPDPNVHAGCDNMRIADEEDDDVFFKDDEINDMNLNNEINIHYEEHRL